MGHWWQAAWGAHSSPGTLWGGLTYTHLSSLSLLGTYSPEGPFWAHRRDMLLLKTLHFSASRH